jgi:hypothetical protein
MIHPTFTGHVVQPHQIEIMDGTSRLSSTRHVPDNITSPVVDKTSPSGHAQSQPQIAMIGQECRITMQPRAELRAQRHDMPSTIKRISRSYRNQERVHR